MKVSLVTILAGVFLVAAVSLFGKPAVIVSALPLDAPWTADEQINVSTIDPYNSTAMDVDGAGNTYVLWHGDSGQSFSDAVRFRYRSSGGVWSGEEVVAILPCTLATVECDIGLDIAADDAGNAYAVWGDPTNQPGNVYFSYRPAGGSWSSPVQVNDVSASAQWCPSIAVDGFGNAYVVWEDYRHGDLDDEETDIYFSYRPSGGGWSSDVRVNDDAAGANENWLPEIAVDSTGNAHVIWMSDRTSLNDVYYSYRPAGGSWQTNVRVNDIAGSHVWYFDIAVDGSGNAYVAWIDDHGMDHDVRLAHRPAGGSWQSSERVNLTSCDYPEGVAVAVTDGGAAVVLWNPGYDTARYTMHSRYRTPGGYWRDEELVPDAYSPDQLSQPHVAIDGVGNAYAVWSAQRDGGEDDDYIDSVDPIFVTPSGARSLPMQGGDSSLRSE